MTCVIWNLALVCLETVLVSVQDMCMVCAKCTIVLETILEAPVGSLVKRLKWKLGLIYLEIVLILMQDRFTVCMEHTI
jgi:hypothetical protein